MIAVGDLVILVRTHDCAKGAESFLGYIFTVTGMANSGTYCPRCYNVFLPEMCVLGLEKYFTPMSWVKKIQPLRELESVEEEEKLEA